jgi:hypothetical protein
VAPVSSLSAVSYHNTCQTDALCERVVVYGTYVFIIHVKRERNAIVAVID